MYEVFIACLVMKEFVFQKDNGLQYRPKTSDIFVIGTKLIKWSSFPTCHYMMWDSLYLQNEFKMTRFLSFVSLYNKQADCICD